MRKTLTTTLLALALAAGPALADGNKGKGNGHGKGKGGSDRHHVQGHGHPGRGPGHDNGRHLGWHKQAWKRGDRLPLAELGPRYYVEDYRTYELAPPRQGQRWVRADENRYLLIDIATGLIDRALGY